MRANHFSTILAIAGTIALTSCAKKASKDESELAAISTVIASESELPTCSAETISQVYWVEEQGKMVVCNGSQFVEIKGEKGDTGETGAAGSTGPAGSAANSGVWVFDADSKPIGVLLDASKSIVLFTNGGLASMNFLTGAFKEPIAVDTSGLLGSAQCSYTDASCSTTCYQTKSSIGSVVKGAIYKSNSTYFVASGVEDLVLNVNLANILDTVAGCAASPSVADAYAIAKPYAFPEGISFPLKTPLSFGFKTGQ